MESLTAFVPDLIALLAALLLAGAAVHDTATRTIPNRIPAVLAMIGVVAHLVSGNMLDGVTAGVVMLACSISAWSRGWLGGGDVKLASAFALVAQPDAVAGFATVTLFAGGVLALVYVALRLVVRHPRPGRRTTLLRRVAKAEAWRVCRGGPLPYAVAIAVGGICCLCSAP